MIKKSSFRGACRTVISGDLLPVAYEVLRDILDGALRGPRVVWIGKKDLCRIAGVGEDLCSEKIVNFRAPRRIKISPNMNQIAWWNDG